MKKNINISIVAQLQSQPIAPPYCTPVPHLS